MKISAIYSIALDDGRCYIGSAVNCTARWNRHKHNLRKGNHHSIKLQRAWDKYGEDRFSFFIIETCEVSNLIDREQFWLDAQKPLFNVATVAGSSLGVKHTEEAKMKMAKAASISQRGRKHSEESKAKRSAALKGRKPSLQCIAATVAVCKGRKLTQEHKEKISVASQRMSNETKAKISAAGMGRVQSPETIAKRAASQIGRVVSLETRAKISAANKGRKVSKENIEKIRQANLGRTLSAEHRAAITEANYRRWERVRESK